MAKRHHESKAAERREHKGMEKYERGPVKMHHHSPGFNDGFKGMSSMYMEDYSSGLRARDRMESEKDGMIRDDHRAIANLPQEVMIKPYEQVGPYLPEGIDDTIKGSDRQMMDNDEQRSRYFSPKK